MSTWQKVYLIVMFPIFLVVVLLEPLWIEVKRIYTDGELVKNYKQGFLKFKEVYSKENWRE